MAEVFEKNLNIKRDFDMELLEHIKDEKERVTENPESRREIRGWIGPFGEYLFFFKSAKTKKMSKQYYQTFLSSTWTTA